VLRYIVLRILQGIVTAFVLLTLVFIFARIIGTPIDLIVPPEASPAERQEAAHKLGLDEPYTVQYLKYVGALISGDAGDSIKFHRPVGDLFLERLPNTLRLASLAVLLAVAVGVPVGVLAATRRGTFIDGLARAGSVLGMSAPDFWVGVMLVFFFAVYLRILPVARMEEPTSYILPAVALSFPILAGTARLVRSSLVEALSSEYIKLARIKGVSASAVVWKHGLRNALLPVVTFLGVNIAGLVNGSVAVETVYAWPGVGRLVYEGITGKDYPLVQGLLLILGFMVIALNLSVDILYTYIDPRIRFGQAR